MPKTWSSWMLGVMSSFALRLLGRRTPDMLRVSSRCTAVCRRSWSTSFLQWSSRLFQILAGCSPEHFAHPRQCSEAEVFTRSVPWCCPGLLPGYPGRGPMSISLSLSLIARGGLAPMRAATHSGSWCLGLLLRSYAEGLGGSGEADGPGSPVLA